MTAEEKKLFSQLTKALEENNKLIQQLQKENKSLKKQQIKRNKSKHTTKFQSRTAKEFVNKAQNIKAPEKGKKKPAKINAKIKDIKQPITNRNITSEKPKKAKTKRIKLNAKIKHPKNHLPQKAGKIEFYNPIRQKWEYTTQKQLNKYKGNTQKLAEAKEKDKARQQKKAKKKKNREKHYNEQSAIMDEHLKQFNEALDELTKLLEENGIKISDIHLLVDDDFNYSENIINIDNAYTVNYEIDDQIKALEERGVTIDKETREEINTKVTKLKRNADKFNID